MADKVNALQLRGCGPVHVATVRTLIARELLNSFGALLLLVVAILANDFLFCRHRRCDARSGQPPMPINTSLTGFWQEERNEDGEPDVNYLGRFVVPEASFFSCALPPLLLALCVRV